MRAARRTWLPVWACAGALALYCASVAPTVLWGDDAMFQRTAALNVLAQDGSGHWLWLQLAHAFARLPLGEVAWRVNLLSAVAAAAAIGLTAALALELGQGRVAALAAAVSLAVAHTFWSHAVRAEVYTVFLAVLTLQLWCWCRWTETRTWPALLGALLVGPTILGHQMGVFALPAVAYLVVRRRAWLTRAGAAALLACGATGLADLVWVVHAQVGAPTIVASLLMYFTRAGVDFGPAMLDYRMAGLPRDVALWIGFLGLQFVGPAALLALYALWRGRGWLGDVRWQALALLFAVNVGFALTYRVNDAYVFFLPSYLAAALVVGQGAELVAARWGGLRRAPAQAGLLAALAVTPAVVYLLLALLFARQGINPLGVRSLPEREPNLYFLWPAKASYTGARTYGLAAFAALPPQATLIADHTPLEPLRYLQSIEGVRPDVRLVKIEPGDDLGPVIAGLQGPVFVADQDPRYYNLTTLPGVRLAATGPVFAVVRDAPAGER